MKTELQSTRLCDLPEDLRPLSINGSHFDVRGVDHPAALRAAPEGLDTRGRAINDAAFGRDHAPPRVTFDHLGEQDVTPRAQPRSPTLPGRHGIAKSLTHGPDGGAEAIGTDQQRTGRRTAAHALDEAPHQRHVAVLTHLARQPYACADHHGQRHPNNAALFLDADRIGLHLPQITWLLDEMLLHGLALHTPSR